MDLSNPEIDRFAEEYRRLRYALPRGTRFIDFLNWRERYVPLAHKRLRDWRDNTRLALGCLEVHIN